MNPFLLLPLIAACDRAPDPQVQPTVPRPFTLVFQGAVAGEIEPTG
ncbi:MAG: hypothetical protein JXB39_13485 [Deltaproteobacteria bacterium]|nr:hypothetical protein [Deltaproteobacteria bacterium]